jgi:integrase
VTQLDRSWPMPSGIGILTTILCPMLNGQEAGKIGKENQDPETHSNNLALMDAVSDQKYKTLFMLAVMSGARQGELLGLKWSDVDYQNNQIHIQRTFNTRLFL